MRHVYLMHDLTLRAVIKEHLDRLLGAERYYMTGYHIVLEEHDAHHQRAILWLLNCRFVTDTPH
jgi:hypothetical protein